MLSNVQPGCHAYNACGQPLSPNIILTHCLPLSTRLGRRMCCRARTALSKMFLKRDLDRTWVLHACMQARVRFKIAQRALKSPSLHTLPLHYGTIHISKLVYSMHLDWSVACHEPRPQCIPPEACRLTLPSPINPIFLP